jgi:hypothetical protein
MDSKHVIKASITNIRVFLQDTQVEGNETAGRPRAVYAKLLRHYCCVARVEEPSIAA